MRKLSLNFFEPPTITERLGVLEEARAARRAIGNVPMVTLLQADTWRGKVGPGTDPRLVRRVDMEIEAGRGWRGYASRRTVKELPLTQDQIHLKDVNRVSSSVLKAITEHVDSGALARSNASIIRPGGSGEQPIDLYILRCPHCGVRATEILTGHIGRYVYSTTIVCSDRLDNHWESDCPLAYNQHPLGTFEYTESSTKRTISKIFF